MKIGDDQAEETVNFLHTQKPKPLILSPCQSWTSGCFYSFGLTGIHQMFITCKFWLVRACHLVWVQWRKSTPWGTWSQRWIAGSMWKPKAWRLERRMISYPHKHPLSGRKNFKEFYADWLKLGLPHLYLHILILPCLSHFIQMPQNKDLGLYFINGRLGKWESSDTDPEHWHWHSRITDSIQGNFNSLHWSGQSVKSFMTIYFMPNTSWFIQTITL